ncbi:MAG: Gfo/Idh/MocA family oxidoreductase [Chloroflexota bacterium]
MTPLRFAIIGAGNIGKIQAEAIAHIPDTEVTVVCNRGEEAGRALARHCQAGWVADFAQAVVRDDVDIVTICTPSGTHTEIAVAAAQAGKHLLVEKPIDITLPRVDAIINAAEQAGIVLACVFPTRFADGPHKAKEALDAGRLGVLSFADCYVKWFRDQAYYDGNWRGTWALDGGGALMNQSIHSIDLLQWLAGPIKRVTAKTKTLAHEMETEDTAAAILEFENGALGVIQGATSCWPGDRQSVQLRGDKGTIELAEGRIVTWQLADAAEGEEEAMLNLEQAKGSGAADPTAIGFEMHRRQIVDVIEAIRDDRSPRILGAEARKSVELIRAIYHSSQTGYSVELPLQE